MEARGSRPDSSWHTPYLRAMEITGVAESQRTWSIRWIERFTEFLRGKPLCAAAREDVESFIAFLRSHPGAEEWKLRRASDALRLLITAVYGKRWEPSRMFPEGARWTPGGWTRCGLLAGARVSLKTEEAYAHWVRRFERFRLSKAGGSDTDAVRAFLERLVTVDMVSASTQAQALNALVFWFKQALGRELGELGGFQKAKRPRFVPAVLRGRRFRGSLPPWRGAPR